MLNTKKWLAGVIAGVFTVGLAVPALAEKMKTSGMHT